MYKKRKDVIKMRRILFYFAFGFLANHTSDKKFKDQDVNRELFVKIYHSILTEFSEKIKNKRKEYYDSCVLGNHILGIIGRGMVFGTTLGRVRMNTDEELYPKNYYSLSYSFENNIYDDQRMMEMNAKKKLSDMKQELKEVQEKIANTSFLKKILVWII